MKQKEGIVLEGYEGTWYVINEEYFNGRKLYLLESEDLGEEVPFIIVDEEKNVILEEAWNGFDDLDE